MLYDVLHVHYTRAVYVPTRTVDITDRMITGTIRTTVFLFRKSIIINTHTHTQTFGCTRIFSAHIRQVYNNNATWDVPTDICSRINACVAPNATTALFRRLLMFVERYRYKKADSNYAYNLIPLVRTIRNA